MPALAASLLGAAAPGAAIAQDSAGTDATALPPVDITAPAVRPKHTPTKHAQSTRTVANRGA
ncbi:hypothetical protein, partial [Bradyrhizobium sp.]|uniref:hypothetical protein n=1 Tax=Bradyrhizobium sp. TaxID=376 RepID=UPI003C6F9BF9